MAYPTYEERQQVRAWFASEADSSHVEVWWDDGAGWGLIVHGTGVVLWGESPADLLSMLTDILREA